MQNDPHQDGTSLRIHRPSPIRHEGPCGPRRLCWRPECLNRFGEYATVEVLRDGRGLAYCHGVIHRDIVAWPELAA